MTKHTQEGWPETLNILPGEATLRKLGRGVVEFFSLHQLSSHGDHFQKDPHPFDAALYDAPNQMVLDWSYPDTSQLEAYDD